MKKVFSAYREGECELWDRLIKWANNQKDKSEEVYLNEEKVIIVEVLEDSK